MLVLLFVLISLTAPFFFFLNNAEVSLIQLKEWIIRSSPHSNKYYLEIDPQKSGEIKTLG